MSFDFPELTYYILVHNNAAGVHRTAAGRWQ